MYCMCFVFSGLQRSTDSPIVFRHQSHWHKKFMQLYGSELCVIDFLTYNTTVYDLPMFVVCVLTNVGYVSVASFLLSDERQEFIAADLRQLSDWNPEWKRKHIMTDFNEGQINGAKSVFQVKSLFTTLTGNFYTIMAIWSKFDSVLQYNAVHKRSACRSLFVLMIDASDAMH